MDQKCKFSDISKWLTFISLKQYTARRLFTYFQNCHQSVNEDNSDYREKGNKELKCNLSYCLLPRLLVHCRSHLEVLEVSQDDVSLPDLESQVPRQSRLEAVLQLLCLKYVEEPSQVKMGLPFRYMASSRSKDALMVFQ